MQTIWGFYNSDGKIVKSAQMAAADTSLKTRSMPLPFSNNCTVFVRLTSNTGSKDITVKARLVYGADIQDAQFTLGIVTATTSGAVDSWKLERDFAGNWNPEANEIEIELTKTSGTIITAEVGINVS